MFIGLQGQIFGCATPTEDYDGEFTEAQKCGFGALNRRLGDGGQVGYHGRYLLDRGSGNVCLP